MANDATQGNDTPDYGAQSITVLKGLEAVRKRPGMYIGSTGENGFTTWSTRVDNSIDEALAGHCDRIDVTIHRDNSITVNDTDGASRSTSTRPKGIPGVESR